MKANLALLEQGLRNIGVGKFDSYRNQLKAVRLDLGLLDLLEEAKRDQLLHQESGYESDESRDGAGDEDDNEDQHLHTLDLEFLHTLEELEYDIFLGDLMGEDTESDSDRPDPPSNLSCPRHIPSLFLSANPVHPTLYPPSPMPLLKINPLSTQAAEVVHLDFDTKLLPISSTGFQGKRTQSLFKHLARNEILAKLMYYNWDAMYDLVICNREGRGLVYCLANPRDLQWLAYIHPELCRILEKARLNGKFTAKQMYHRQGDFFKLMPTIFQTSLSNTKHTQRDGQVLETLLSNDANTKQMTRLYEPQTPPSARISPTPYLPPPPSTLVLKPLLLTTLAMETMVQEVAPSPAQDTKGGELVLWDLGIAIRFPPGSSIIILSAILCHSNLPIQPGEKQYSITQYSAGALF
ncbi:hypothetical protein GYMLUDRAFT_244218 [Collybiopsis luxurians FD-317 M1]|uniref:Uncharacterized protein n=1 Tax=Collybiopsis luxurians FD-317 M1 TaxID=944289 RepID=A0A0D0BAC2_9AGAR|nr:hypothetical protein GYMLUDRAFT_244218 [Collybiopsis luxurians FD-317 M1]